MSFLISCHYFIINNNNNNYYYYYIILIWILISLQKFLYQNCFLIKPETSIFSAATEIPHPICIPVSSALCSLRAARRLRAVNLVCFGPFLFSCLHSARESTNCTVLTNNIPSKACKPNGKSYQF